MIKKSIHRLAHRLALSTPQRRNDVVALINSVKGRQSFLLMAEKLLTNYGFPYPENYFYSYERHEQILYVADKLLGTYGVECVRLSEYDKNYSVMQDAIAEYLNTGETYCYTLVYRYDTVRHWHVMCFGDLVETLERQGRKLQ